jgi:hypothetical protein
MFIGRDTWGVKINGIITISIGKGVLPPPFKLEDNKEVRKLVGKPGCRCLFKGVKFYLILKIGKERWRAFGMTK